MYIQLLVCLIFALGYNSYRNSIITKRFSGNEAVTKYIHFVCFVLILQSGFRNVAVGADTYAYYTMFEKIQVLSWHEIFTTFINTYEAGVGKDPGYLVFMKIISLITPVYRIYLIIIAIVFFSAFGSLLKTFCNSVYDVFIGGVLYEVLFYGFFSVTGIRQTIAVAILFFSVRFIIRRKFILFLLTCLIAATIHKSALIFAPFYYIALNRKPMSLLFFIVASLPVVFAIVRPFAQFLTSFSFSESYASYANSQYETDGAQMFLIFMLAISIIAIICRRDIKNAPDTIKICCNAFSLGLLFTPLTWVDPSFMRVVMYYSVFSVFFIGKLMNYFSKYSRFSLGAISFSMVILFMFIIIKRGAEYAFFWQEMALGANYGFTISTVGI